MTGCGGDQAPIASLTRQIPPGAHLPVAAPAPLPTHALDPLAASGSEACNRPHRNRNPPKKYLEEVSKMQ
ncbi:hypothetical protein V2G26_016581 [Clonostachys chloroleuca]